MQWFITYEDDGPRGACGQQMSTTSPWRKLFRMLGTYEDVRAMAKKMLSSTARKRPRIAVFLLGSESQAAKLGVDRVEWLPVNKSSDSK